MIFNGISKSDAVTSNIKKFIAEPTQQELDQKIKENEERVKEAEEVRKAGKGKKGCRERSRKEQAHRAAKSKRLEAAQRS